MKMDYLEKPEPWEVTDYKEIDEQSFSNWIQQKYMKGVEERKIDKEKAFYDALNAAYDKYGPYLPANIRNELEFQASLIGISWDEKLLDDRED